MRVCVSTALGLALLLWSWPATAAAQPLDPPRLRRPVAAAWIESGRLLAVANQRSGTVSIVDIPGRKVIDEIAVGERLSDIAAGSGGGRLFAVDEKRHELIVLDRDGDSLRVSNRVPVSAYPVSVAVSPDGSRITVASLWSRALTILEPNIDRPAEAAELRALAEIPLQFAPRKQLMLPDGKHLVVADAFGGGLNVVGIQKCKSITNHQLAGHNIRGLAMSLDGVHLLVAREKLFKPFDDYPKRASYLAVARGCVDRILIDDILHPMVNGQKLRYQQTIVRSGPDDVVDLDGSLTAVLLAGESCIHVARRNKFPVIDTELGFKPVQMLTDPSGTLLIVVNSFSDSLSLVDHKIRSPIVPIKLGPAPVFTAAERGEVLFYDPRLSLGGWMSCHSCHTDGHTNGQLADTLGDGTHGTPKRIPTLLGTRLTDKWAWNGEVRELHEQVAKSLENTMHSPNFTPEQVMDLTAYLHTLPFPPPLEPATDEPADQAQLTRGETLFGSLGCAKCHVPPLTYTSQDDYDVGLADEKGLTKFNPPSLRGVSQGYSFFHDGRAKALEEVFTVHGHQLSRELSKHELADLLRFLRSL